MQAVTFHPHINQHSLDIMQERRGSSHSASFLNRLEADIHGRKMRLQVSSHDDILSGHIAWPVISAALMLAHKQPHAGTPAASCCTPAALCFNSSLICAHQASCLHTSSLMLVHQQPCVCRPAAPCLHTSSLMPAVASVAAAASCLTLAASCQPVHQLRCKAATRAKLCMPNL